MLNPILSNFRIELGDEFFPDELIKPYNRFLMLKNNPLKSLQSYLYETIQNFDIPGLNLQTIIINALNNRASRPNMHEPSTAKSYPGTSPINDIIEGNVLNITMRNSLLNWMYCYTMLRAYYSRKRETDTFYISIVVMDSAEIPMIRFKLGDCFLSAMPGLSFAYNQSFNESKTFDAGFTFNTFDVDFLLPNFNITSILNTAGYVE